MSVVARDFLEFASACCDQQTEVSARNAVGRAYYACYHECVATIPFEHFKGIGDESAHNKLILAYMKYGNSLLPGRTVAKEISVMLGHLRSARVKADYKLDLDFNLSFAKSELAYAHALMEKVAAFQSALANKAA